MPGARATRSSLLDTRIITCGDCLEHLSKLPDACIDLVYIDPPLNCHRSDKVFWGESRELPAVEDRHASSQACIEFMRPVCQELARVLKKGGSFYYHCDWHASHDIKVMMDQVLGQNNFVNELIWKRQSASNDGKQVLTHPSSVHDTLLLYSGGTDYTFHQIASFSARRQASRSSLLITLQAAVDAGV